MVILHFARAVCIGIYRKFVSFLLFIARATPYKVMLDECLRTSRLFDQIHEQIMHGGLYTYLCPAWFLKTSSKQGMTIQRNENECGIDIPKVCGHKSGVPEILILEPFITLYLIK